MMLLNIILTCLLLTTVGAVLWARRAAREEYERASALEAELQKAEQTRRDMVETWTRRLNKLNEEKETIKDEICAVLKKH